MNINENKRFALLIDADNAQAKAIDAILTEAARYGDATSRRCYGDWTNTQLGSWKSDDLINMLSSLCSSLLILRGKNATSLCVNY